MVQSSAPQSSDPPHLQAKRFGLVDSVLSPILWRFVSLWYWNTQNSFPVTDIVVEEDFPLSVYWWSWDRVTNFAQILQFVTSLKRIYTLFCISFSVILHSLATVSVSFPAVSRLQSVDGPQLYQYKRFQVFRMCLCQSTRFGREFARFAMATEKNNVEHVSATNERIKPALSFHSIRGFISWTDRYQI